MSLVGHGTVPASDQPQSPRLKPCSYWDWLIALCEHNITKTKRKSHHLVTSQVKVRKLCGQMLHNILETSAFVIPCLVFVIRSNAMLKIRNISLFSDDKATCGISEEECLLHHKRVWVRVL
jgi:hypothetical protein